MPLIIDGGRVPTRWAENRGAGAAGLIADDRDCVRIALINNMPDPALEDTELQFFDLLDSASDDLLVVLRLYSLSGVPRTDRGRPHINEFYFEMDDLWNGPCDAIIMTGAEPRLPNLREEPYWQDMVDVLDWAERSTTSSILSCLAAHASVLHSDGIPRHPLKQKCSGVFEFTKSARHPLIARSQEPVRFPHSRWNEVRAEALADCGYDLLTESAEAGVDCFVKQKRESLFVHFQGHPEYTSHTLFKEYRRDVKRFLRRERDDYPMMPYGYFDPAVAKQFSEFEKAAIADRGEERMAEFPDAGETLQASWRASALAIYHSWLDFVAGKKSEVTTLSAMTAFQESNQRKRSAVR